MTDKNNSKLKVGMQVSVPEPNDSDIHYFEFVGTVADIFEEREIVVVEDQDSDFFEIKGNRLEIWEETV